MCGISLACCGRYRELGRHVVAYCSGFTPPCCRDRRVAPVGSRLRMLPHTAWGRRQHSGVRGYCCAPRHGSIFSRKWRSYNVPLRNSRRKSVLPPGGLGKNELEVLDEPSPQASITSVNSISSLLREKLALTLPAILKKKRRPEQYKLKAFVGILFLCIVFLVGFAHVYYHQQVLQRAYFEFIRFNHEERVVRVYNDAGAEVLLGDLGTMLRPGRGHNCLVRDQRSDGSVCLEWMHQARLYLNHRAHGPVHCYHVTWESLAEGSNLTDCYDWSEDKGHWFGGGQTREMAWPAELGTVEMSPFITGHVDSSQWGNALKRYFIGSKGVTITVDPNTPLYVSIGVDASKRLCLHARHDDFAYAYPLTPLPKLNYTICRAANMKLLHSFLAEKSLWDGLRKDDLDIIHSIISEPVWQVSPSSSEALTEAALYNYTEDIIGLGFLRQGHVLLNEFWQSHAGDFVLDELRFPTLEETIKIIHRRGFRIIFTIQPFISTESVNFHEAVEEQLLVSERGGRHHIPSLTTYKSSLSAGMLDITNNRVIPWLQAKLKGLVDEYSVDSFYIDYGTAHDLPYHYRFENKLRNPDEYKTLFTEAVLQSVGVTGVSSTIVRPRAPVFVSLPPFSSSWESLGMVIPTVLTYGLTGYPFIMPGAVGGDYDIESFDEDNLTTTTAKTAEEFLDEFDFPLPDKELYIRWLQLATFLPVIRYSHLPSKYEDDDLLEIVKALTTLRVKTVNPLLKKYVQDALDFGTPIIRPLWLLDPRDPACLTVADEFSVGEELIVAPVLFPDTTEREVYLPAGVWKDGIDGSLRKGSRWLHSYRVPREKVAYFIKMPDNTRF
ncbi:myogenesis-regulating glycosidase isoform X2 [Bacillus rossius redtenbacheri]|uniref:myogenesis-regulating glycosidase isoform X2 n=1 Tax=Bacillus rossius redtenbacheri TaxID=93214 RepID=UPI002FDD8F9A